jgi:hypothetical protein
MTDVWRDSLSDYYPQGTELEVLRSGLEKIHEHFDDQSNDLCGLNCLTNIVNFAGRVLYDADEQRKQRKQYD